MPELPEVETIVRELQESHLTGAQIVNVEVFWPGIIASSSVLDFCSQVIDQSIVEVKRRGKYIVIILTKQTLLIHLRMTGKLNLTKKKGCLSSHERIQLLLKDGRILHYEDQRKFGKWELIPHTSTKLNQLGIEPLSDDFTLKNFQQILKKSQRQIKPFLMDQRYVAGLGNMYVDEALWEAKIHPKCKVDTLNSSKIQKLFQSIVKVLKEGIEHTGAVLGSKSANYYSVSGHRGGPQTQLKVFRREGLTCSRCHTKIIKIKVGQRGTHLCPHCQKL